MVESRKLKIFISHSGERSSMLAKAIARFITHVIQNAKCFVSETDIEPGQKWLQRISDELRGSSFGIICLTPENTNSRWINYEAGCLSKELDTSRVCPILLSIAPQNVGLPLSQFQCRTADSNGMFDLIKSINHTFGDDALPDEQLKLTFEKFWHEAEVSIEEIQHTQAKFNVESAIQDLAQIGNVVQFMETFPELLDPLNNAISKATNSIRVVADFVCYALFAAPARSAKYRNALKDAARRGINVELVVPIRERQKELVQQRLGKRSRDFDALKQGRQANYFDIITKATGKKPANMREFVEGVLDVHEMCAEKEFKGRVLRCLTIPPQYFWIIDGKDAFFAVPRTDANGVELGFKTNEKHVVEVFENTWARLSK